MRRPRISNAGAKPLAATLIVIVVLISAKTYRAELKYVEHASQPVATNRTA
ncbi:hypothetical protein [Burkholderia gladioli]|uniref:hypothetical protein n=1 Tax=Burkholderia gladioli TaxID=28095 RepID=UPI00164009FC|nr:hypothetical protein [Burkholderia gladioli]